MRRGGVRSAEREMTEVEVSFSEVRRGVATRRGSNGSLKGHHCLQTQPSPAAQHTDWDCRKLYVAAALVDAARLQHAARLNLCCSHQSQAHSTLSYQHAPISPVKHNITDAHHHCVASPCNQLSHRLHLRAPFSTHQIMSASLPPACTLMTC